MKKVYRFLVAFMGTSIVIGAEALLFKMLHEMKLFDLGAAVPPLGYFLVYAVIAVVAYVALWMIADKLLLRFKLGISKIEKMLADRPTPEILAGSFGLTMGLFIAWLITNLYSSLNLGMPGLALSAIIYIVLGYLGVAIGVNRYMELPLPSVIRRAQHSIFPAKEDKITTKILDTSVIVDGRIFDICATGFLDGPLVVPRFVLDELHKIADSADGQKRNRGRRGLDVLAKMQKELDLLIIIDETDYTDLNDVDVKLLRLATQLKGKVVTNDYNLNKVALATGMKVLNINELANAMKPTMMAGEEMMLHILKEGKEAGQGISFLDDGTMVVVENGRKFIGETVSVTVSSVLQTAAGRMIFAKI